MTPYRKEFNKIYNKIYKLAQKGTDYVFEYFLFIDELIEKGQFEILEDIMITKFEIPIKNFLSIEDFKKFSFKEIRKFTNSNTSESIKKLLDNKGVYLVGYHLFDKNNNHYLGDLREIETQLDSIYTNKNLIKIIIDVQAEVGLNPSISSAIPNFETNATVTINYKVGNHLIYIDNIYECIQSYTWSSTNKITPTFSAYWQQVQAPSYSSSLFTASSSLLDKYSNAIDYLKTFTYSYI